MDPLSVGASIIAVATLAAQVGTLFNELRNLHRELPGRLHAVGNEVTDLELVLRRLALVVESRQIKLGDKHADLDLLLQRAVAKLGETRRIVDRITSRCTQVRSQILAVGIWQVLHPRLQSIQADLRDVKSNINLLLGASQLHDTMQVRLEIAAISTNTSKAAGEQTALLAEFASCMRSYDDRIATMENMLRTQTTWIQEKQYQQVGSDYDRPRLGMAARPLSSTSAPYSPIQMTDGLTVKVNTHLIKCRVGCFCVCHSQQRTSSPNILNKMFGQLFIGYVGVPCFTPKCDVNGCQRSRARQLSLEYWFPWQSISSSIVRLQLGYDSTLGTMFHLDTLRRVPDSAQCVTFALHGDIEGLKYLFKNGLASPRDVSSTRGYSVLRWALYGKQYKTCDFLIQAGADPDHKPIAQSDDNPRNKACTFLLEGNLDQSAQDSMHVLANREEFGGFIDQAHFTQLHRIILGLSLGRLEDELVCHPEDLDEPDRILGRTPIAWAACRGDHRSLALLLAAGADPNRLDAQVSDPVSMAAATNHTICVRMLLEAGAVLDMPKPGNEVKGSALNLAARNADDVAILKTLLDFGAKVDSCGVDGNTGLIHAARRDNASFAMLFLDHSANINARSSSGATPLTTAMMYNSHNVLRLMLDRWREYSSCPRLTGPHLLQLAAQYADLETMKILTATDHFKIKQDKLYGRNDCNNLLSQRLDYTDELAAAFADLLSVMNHVPRGDQQNLLEAGLAHAAARPKPGFIATILPCLGDDIEESTAREISPSSGGTSPEDFEDALEDWGIVEYQHEKTPLMQAMECR